MNTTEKVSVMDWSDSLVFTSMLTVSTMIGIYFGCFGSKQKDPQEYLLGGKTMRPIPVALSMAASFISGTTLIAVPAEVYTEGCSYWLYTVAVIFTLTTSYYCIIPVFYDANVDSGFEYLELRYGRSIRLLCSTLYCASYMLLLPTIIYIPSLTLSQATGINLHLISVGVISVCVFYTMIGGFKAVIWTDFFQLIITIITCIAIIIIGTIDAGGMNLVFKIAYNNNKLDIFNMDLNPFQRNTFWTIFIGSYTMTLFTMGVNQACIQRYLSIASRKDLPLVLVIAGLSIGTVITFGIYSGLVIYTIYYGCDPIAEKIVSKADQIFPYYILDKIGHVPTLPGFFMAGVFSAALSTMSTALNTIAGTIYEDYIKSSKHKDKAHVLMKSVIVLTGILSMLLVFVVEQMGKILSTVYIVTSITTTPVLVMFIMGMTMPRSNKKGVLAGAISAMVFIAWIAIGSSMQKVNFATKNVYPINTCLRDDYHNYNSTTSTDISKSSDEVFFLFKLSYMLYNTFGLIIGLPVGYLTSYFTGFADSSRVNPKLISPPLRRFLQTKEEDILMIDYNEKK